MKVDLTGALNSALQKAIQEYRKADECGDTRRARGKALECAGLLEQIARSSPGQHEIYMKRAGEWRQVADQVEARGSGKVVETAGGGENEFLTYAESLIAKTPVRWGDIGGLEEVKRLMMETIVIAGLNKPDSIKPWKGILLFGPPGTGKTLLAAAAAGSLNATFFDVKADRVLSKYFGESSKMVSGLYAAARMHSPSIVFVDEFDALSQSRSGDTSEATRKLLSTLLTELDGLQDKKSGQLLLTLAATNTPWDLDPAVLSRFPRRIYVTLPDAGACREILKIHMKDLDSSSLDFDALATRCVENHYSGRDLQNLCQQAIWHMIREENTDLYQLAELPFDELKERSLKVRALCAGDFEDAFEKIKSPITESDIQRYHEWNENFGE
jgi:katanin p60 ATPase-containing subunit A1